MVQELFGRAVKLFKQQGRGMGLHETKTLEMPVLRSRTDRD